MTALIDEMARQAQGMGPDVFICSTCANYEGNLKCLHNAFIAFEYANTSKCRWYLEGVKCKHCGKIT